MRRVPEHGLVGCGGWGELPVETTHAAVAHLEPCAECRNELQAHAALRQTLRARFAASPELATTEEFVSAVRGGVLQGHRRRSRVRLSNRVCRQPTARGVHCLRPPGQREPAKVLTIWRQNAGAFEVTKTEPEWRRILTPEQFYKWNCGREQRLEKLWGKSPT